MAKEERVHWAFPLSWGVFALVTFLLLLWTRQLFLVVFCLIFTVGTVDTTITAIKSRNKE